MLLLVGTTDKLQVITGSAATVDVVASFVDATNADPPVVQGDSMGTTPTAITTATTTDVVATPASGDIRNVKTIHIRNKHATTATDVTVVFNRSATSYELYKCNLAPGEALEYVEGVGFFEVAASPATAIGGSTNYATASTSSGFASDTYLDNTKLTLAALGTPTVGRRYSFRIVVSKTAAGTAAPTLIVRIGTAGTTSDTARITFTWGAGTAAVDRGEIEAECIFTTVGASAVLRGKANFTTNLTTTGLSNAVKALQVTSGTFDSTVANSFIGLSWNGGASAVHTVEWQAAYTDQL